MITPLRYLVFFIFVLGFGIFMGCSDSNSNLDPEQSNSETFDTYAGVLGEDFDRLEATGVRLDSTDGIFSVGWNEFFDPMSSDTVTHGHAFAVAFDDSNSQNVRPIKRGIDMGSVFINYKNNHIELHKIVKRFGGVLYALFPKPTMGNVLEFVPNAIYEFEVTGTSNFSPVNITLTTPPALINFTSHAHGDTINTNNDLVLAWSGGTPNDPVAIHILPSIFFQRMLRERMGGFGPSNHGNFRLGFGNGIHFKHGDNSGFGPYSIPFCMPIHMGIFVVLPDNPGQYTVAAADLQNLLDNANAAGIICHVSQLSSMDVDHDGKILRAVMRNGDQLMLNVQ